MLAARLTLAVLLVTSTAACAGTGPSESPVLSPAATPGAIALRTQEPQPAGTAIACPAALIEGTLVRDDQSGVALRDPQGQVRQVIWPNGYSAREDDGRLAVVDASGMVLAHEGDRVMIGGGEIDADGTWLGCGGTKVLTP